MSFDTYANLQTEIAGMLNRDDLASAIPSFISLAEAQISRDIRHYRMENRANSTASEQYLTLPNDWVETKRFTVGGDPCELVSTDRMATLRAGNDDLAGKPFAYRLCEQGFELYPTPDKEYAVELVYIQKIPALSASNASNWLLQQFPDVYFYGALIHSAPYLMDDQRIQVWAQLYGAAVANVNRTGEKSRFSGAILRPTVRGLG